MFVNMDGAAGAAEGETSPLDTWRVHGRRPTTSSMGKNKKRRLAATLHEATPAASAAGLHAADALELHADDLAAALRVVRHLGTNPDVLASKALRELRTALHPLVLVQLRKYEPADYAAKVTAAMRAARWADALGALAGLRAAGQVAKQGTVQRWVRDCDSVTPQSMQVRLLDAVLRAGRLANPSELAADAAAEDAAEHGGDAGAEEAGGGNGGAPGGLDANADAGVDEAAALSAASALAHAASNAGEAGDIRRHAPWAPPPAAAAPDGVEVGDSDDLGIRVVLLERGAARQPANHYDRRIYAASARAVPLLPTALAAPRVRPLPVPNVPGATLLTGLLAPAECASILHVTRAMGFAADHPTSKPAPTGIGAIEWVADAALLEALWVRAAPHVPAGPRGAPAVGINAHWRLFAYSEGAVYRPHIDGSWPGAGVGPDGSYVYDLRDGRRSRHTFLIYLNEGFDGGATTFFMPSAGGGMDAWGVAPQVGAALCFPQANVCSLLHEGSPVTRGVKYVIRTDVMYDLGAGPPTAPAAL